jgi:hypothetical protein
MKPLIAALVLFIAAVPARAGGESHHGTLVGYDASTGCATLIDHESGQAVTALDTGVIGGGGAPEGSLITYIRVYLPPRGPEETARIVNIIKEIHD